MRKVELLVPASSLEVLKVAVIFGADAVYIGGEVYGLRAKAKNFSKEECNFFKKLIPKTWNFFHTQNDDFSSLTLESFSVMMRILFSLSQAAFI